MTEPNPVTIRRPAEGRTIGIVGDIYRFLVTGEETGGRYAVFEAIVLPGGGPPPHIHRREDETFCVLEGEITFQVGDEKLIAGPGTFINMPIGNAPPRTPATKASTTTGLLLLRLLLFLFRNFARLLLLIRRATGLRTHLFLLLKSMWGKSPTAVNMRLANHSRSRSNSTIHSVHNPATNSCRSPAA